MTIVRLENWFQTVSLKESTQLILIVGSSALLALAGHFAQTATENFEQREQILASLDLNEIHQITSEYLTVLDSDRIP